MSSQSVADFSSKLYFRCAVNNGSISCISLLMHHGAELNSSKSLDKSARKHPLVCALESRNRSVFDGVVKE